MMMIVPADFYDSINHPFIPTKPTKKMKMNRKVEKKIEIVNCNNIQYSSIEKAHLYALQNYGTGGDPISSHTFSFTSNLQWERKHNIINNCERDGFLAIFFSFCFSCFGARYSNFSFCGVQIAWEYASDANVNATAATAAAAAEVVDGRQQQR